MVELVMTLVSKPHHIHRCVEVVAGVQVCRVMIGRGAEPALMTLRGAGSRIHMADGLTIMVVVSV